MRPLEDLYQTRTKGVRRGTISAEWNHVLLQRDLERLISEGLVEPVTDICEFSPDPSETTWCQEFELFH